MPMFHAYMPMFLSFRLVTASVLSTCLPVYLSICLHVYLSAADAGKMQRLSAVPQCRQQTAEAAEAQLKNPCSLQYAVCSMQSAECREQSAECSEKIPSLYCYRYRTLHIQQTRQTSTSSNAYIVYAISYTHILIYAIGQTAPVPMPVRCVCVCAASSPPRETQGQQGKGRMGRM
jgi:hypothetical protein